MKKSKVLILCTGNSCRSQLAEGILRHLAGDIFEVFSAGSQPADRVNPLAVEVMAEIGIDISDHRTKHVDEFLDAGIDTVVTVCDKAREACPVFPGNIARHHWRSFEDPPHSARPGEEPLEAFRRVRDQLHTAFAAYADGYRQGISAKA